jgi:TetR/AcrR family transcriptional regulator, transcriptional repressor of aconitase
VPKVSDEYLTARRRQILDAAARCFARDGFHRASMTDLVRESGISAGLFYRYFPSKDDIITAIVTEWQDHRQALVTEPSTDFARPYLDVLRSVGHPGALEDLRLGVQVWAEAVRNPQIHTLVRRGVDGPRQATHDLIRQAQHDGVLPADLDPDAFVRILIAIYQGAMLQTVLDPAMDHETFVRTVASILNHLGRD